MRDQRSLVNDRLRQLTNQTHQPQIAFGSGSVNRVTSGNDVTVVAAGLPSNDGPEVDAFGPRLIPFWHCSIELAHPCLGNAHDRKDFTKPTVDPSLLARLLFANASQLIGTD